MQKALELRTTGTLAITQTQLSYLKIDDDYIQQLFPLLGNPLIQKPNYFGQDGCGAHITVIYPEEGTKITNGEVGKICHFSIRDLVMAEIASYQYYVLMIDSPELTKIRKMHGLPDQLSFKDNLIGFHITIGVIKPLLLDE